MASLRINYKVPGGDKSRSRSPVSKYLSLLTFADHVQSMDAARYPQPDMFSDMRENISHNIPQQSREYAQNANMEIDQLRDDLAYAEHMLQKAAEEKQEVELQRK